MLLAVVIVALVAVAGLFRWWLRRALEDMEARLMRRFDLLERLRSTDR